MAPSAHHADPDVDRPLGYAYGCAQITRFGTASGDRHSDLVADHIGGSARVVLYERRSRAVVIGDAFRSRLWSRARGVGSLDVRDGHLQDTRASPLGHELPADE